MERGRDQCAVAAGSCQPRHILRTADATTRQEPHVRATAADAAKQVEIHAPTGSHSPDIQHEQRTDSRGDRTGGQFHGI